MYIIDLLLKNIDKVTGKAKIQAADADIAALGALADLAKTDPAQAASVISSLKGILKQLQGSGTGALPTQLTGSMIDLRGLAANKPAANAVAIGATYWSVDTGAVEVSDGTSWAVI